MWLPNFPSCLLRAVRPYNLGRSPESLVQNWGKLAPELSNQDHIAALIPNER